MFGFKGKSPTSHGHEFLNKNQQKCEEKRETQMANDNPPVAGGPAPTTDTGAPSSGGASGGSAPTGTRPASATGVTTGTLPSGGAPVATGGGSTSSSASPVSPVITTSAVYPPNTNYTGAIIGVLGLLAVLFVGFYFVRDQRVSEAVRMDERAQAQMQQARSIEIKATEEVNGLKDAVEGLKRSMATVSVPSTSTTSAPPATAPPPTVTLPPVAPTPGASSDTNAPSVSSPTCKRGVKKEPETVIVNDNRSYHYYQEKVVTEPRQEPPSSSPPLPEGGVQFKRFSRHFYFTPPAGVPVVEVSGPNTGTIYFSDY